LAVDRDGSKSRIQVTTAEQLPQATPLLGLAIGPARPLPHGDTHEHVRKLRALSEVMTSRATAPVRSSWLGLVPTRLAEWLKDCANHYAAAAAYEELSRLSDTRSGTAD
jgi:hypothetical protein